MSNKAATMWGAKNNFFRCSQKLNQCYIFGTYMERPYSHSSYYIFDTIGIQICDGAGDDRKATDRR